jgi:hypothetical protein
MLENHQMQIELPIQQITLKEAASAMGARTD